MSSISRPVIDFIGGKFTHNNSSVRVVLRRRLISVGCTDVTPEALRQLLKEYDQRFSDTDEIVLQY